MLTMEMKERTTTAVTLNDELMEAFELLDAADGVTDGQISKGKE
jgi:hypothetical protein